MRKILLCPIVFMAYVVCFAADKDSVVYYNLPDSVKVSNFYSEVLMQELDKRKKGYAGSGNNGVRLLLQANKKGNEVVMEFPGEAEVIVTGKNVVVKRRLVWSYPWQVGTTYKLLISTAADSANNFTLYSGSVYLADVQKWKLLGCVKIKGDKGLSRSLYNYFSNGKKNTVSANFSAPSGMRSNNTWKALGESNVLPVVPPTSDADSVQQYHDDMAQIQQAIKKGKTDAVNETNGVYYNIIKEGTGKPISVTDTLVAYYKGYLLKDGTVFDQTVDKPARFPLNRLIRGWQLGLPLIKTGGKIKLVIPSALGYATRTRSPKIPPNSILVFEIEVVDAK